MIPSSRAELSRVVWTRGRGCAEVAALLAGDRAIRIDGDLQRSCIRAAADALVARRLTSFDLVPTIVPHDFDADGVRSVVAAVADGPHSGLAARVAATVATALGVPGDLATVYRSDDEEATAVSRLEALAASAPGLGRRAIRHGSATGLIETLDAGTLLVVGAAGGSWIQRQILGPGHRLVVKTPGGSLVVRDEVRRAFQVAVDPAGFAIGRHMALGAARSVVLHRSVPVADDGVLVGIVRAADLTERPGSATVGDVMEPPVSVEAVEAVEAVEELREFLEGGPVPVVGRDGRLLGVVL